MSNSRSAVITGAHTRLGVKGSAVLIPGVENILGFLISDIYPDGAVGQEGTLQIGDIITGINQTEFINFDRDQMSAAFQFHLFHSTVNV